LTPFDERLIKPTNINYSTTGIRPSKRRKHDECNYYRKFKVVFRLDCNHHCKWYAWVKQLSNRINVTLKTSTSPPGLFATELYMDISRKLELFMV